MRRQTKKLPEIDMNYGTFKAEMISTLFNTKHILPSSNASLRHEFNLMSREVLDGRDPYGGNGTGPKGWAHHFQMKFGITQAHAEDLARELLRVMLCR